MRFVAMAILFFCTSAAYGQAKKLGFDPEAKIKAYLQDNVNDPAQLSFVEFSKPVPAEMCRVYDQKNYGDDNDIRAVSGGWWQPVKKGPVAVVVKYRATNAVGAKVLDTKVFFVDKTLGVVGIESLKNFRIGDKGLLDEDPATAALFKLIDGK